MPNTENIFREAITLRPVDKIKLIDKLWAKEVEDRIDAYDAYMIAGAKLYNAPLLTLDKNLKEKAINSNIIIWEV